MRFLANAAKGHRLPTSGFEIPKSDLKSMWPNRLGGGEEEGTFGFVPFVPFVPWGAKPSCDAAFAGDKARGQDAGELVP